MKRTLYISLAALLCVAGQANAEGGSVAGGFEASGHVDVVAAYQHSDVDAAAASNFGGAAGEFLGNNGGANGDTFGFFIDSVELDIAKSFGENIRLRADIDFGAFPESSPAQPATGGTIVNLEQAYATTNIGAGNGGEFLVGKFNAPIGFEPVDRTQLHTVSHGNIFNFVTPSNLTGAKIYYAFGDVVDLNVYVVNSLSSNLVTVDSALPSVGGRLGFTWGEEGDESTLGISAAAGPEQNDGAAVPVSQNAHWDLLGDIDFAFQVTENLLIGGEGVYRQRNALDATVDNAKVLGGELLLNYAFSEVWDGTFRYDYLNDVDDDTPFFAATAQTIHAWTLAAGYQIADGAKFKLEYKFEFVDPQGGNKSDYHAVAVEYAYNF